MCDSIKKRTLNDFYLRRYYFITRTRRILFTQLDRKQLNSLLIILYSKKICFMIFNGDSTGPILLFSILFMLTTCSLTNLYLYFILIKKRFFTRYTTKIIICFSRSPPQTFFMTRISIRKKVLLFLSSFGSVTLFARFCHHLTLFRSTSL